VAAPSGLEGFGAAHPLLHRGFGSVKNFLPEKFEKGG
jgi:hypothetical protein